MMRLLFLLPLLLSLSCSNNDNVNDDKGKQPQKQEIALADDDVSYDKNTSFIVISKKDLQLIVYAQSGNDTIALAAYPVCIGKNKGQKKEKGDMRTPESSLDHPFSITNIQDASTWTHDFGDGRGAILAYGHWFMRLKTPGHNGIGIHGSTNNENTVPGRGSEGCIRLLDKDIIQLKEKYARIGMPVIIKHEDQGLLPFETKCLK